MKFGLLPRIITAIVLGVIVGSFAPLWFVKTAATFNDIFGSFIKFVIPFIIIAFIIPGIGQIGRGAGKILGITAGIAYTSTILQASWRTLSVQTFFPRSFPAISCRSLKIRKKYCKQDFSPLK